MGEWGGPRGRRLLGVLENRGRARGSGWLLGLQPKAGRRGLPGPAAGACLPSRSQFLFLTHPRKHTGTSELAWT